MERSSSRSGNSHSKDGTKGKNGNNKQQNESNKRWEGQKSGGAARGTATAQQQPANGCKRKSALDKSIRPRNRGKGGTFGQAGPKNSKDVNTPRDWPLHKNMSLKNLLNFTLAPRGEGADGGSGVRRKKWNSRDYRKTGYHKQQFLHANCQCVVRRSSQQDLTLHSFDPDTPVDWQQIEQIRIWWHEPASCPICLYPPVAAKITSCGHIYCWPCILHYLALGDKARRRCPICYQPISKNDLKSVTVSGMKVHRVGSSIEMKLMRRKRGSCIALPASRYRLSTGPYPIEDVGVDTNFLRLLDASDEQLLAIVDVEKRELDMLMGETDDEMERGFVTEALQLLADRRGKLEGTPAGGLNISADCSGGIISEGAAEGIAAEEALATGLDGKEPEVKVYLERENDSLASAPADDGHDSDLDAGVLFADQVKIVQIMNDDGDGLPHGEDGMPEVDGALPTLEEESSVDEGGSLHGGYGLASSDCNSPTAAEDEFAVGELESIASDESRNEKNVTGGQVEKRKGKEEFYFYQACDGQHVYLHSVNVKCLVEEYGALEQCPLSFSATIVELDNFCMTEEFRRRMRYLGHLPISCEYQVAELRLVPPLVSLDTLAMFADDLQKRSKQRRKHRQSETKWNNKAKKQEIQKQLADSGGGGGWQRQFSPVERHYDNKEVLSECPPLSPPSFSSQDCLQQQDNQQTPQQDSFPSFAQIAKKLHDDEPRGSAAAVASSSVHGVTWLQQPAATAVTAGSRGSCGGEKALADSDEDGAGCAAAPAYQQAFGDAIQAALDDCQRRESSEAAQAEDKSTSEEKPGKKKKKGKQRKLLFSTSMSGRGTAAAAASATAK